MHTAQAHPTDRLIPRGVYEATTVDLHKAVDSCFTVDDKFSVKITCSGILQPSCRTNGRG